MQQYHEMLEYVLNNGELVENRTGINTISVFGYETRFDLSKGFPAITTKRLAWKPVVAELLWFLEGSTDERQLAEIQYMDIRENLVNKNTIWTENANFQGKNLGYTNSETIKELGPVYGYNWRFWGDDQIKTIIHDIQNNPNSRRIILEAWNVENLSKMALPPCHKMAHFRVLNNKLHCKMYIRSNDLFLGAPFNIASYALLTHIIAKETNLEVGDLIYSVGDGHIYENHIDQVKEQLSREHYNNPELVISDKSLFYDGGEYVKKSYRSAKTDIQYDVSDFTLKNYQCHPSIKASMAV